MHKLDQTEYKIGIIGGKENPRTAQTTAIWTYKPMVYAQAKTCPEKEKYKIQRDRKKSVCECCRFSIKSKVQS